MSDERGKWSDVPRKIEGGFTSVDYQCPINSWMTMSNQLKARPASSTNAPSSQFNPQIRRRKSMPGELRPRQADFQPPPRLIDGRSWRKIFPAARGIQGVLFRWPCWLRRSLAIYNPLELGCRIRVECSDQQKTWISLRRPLNSTFGSGRGKSYGIGFERFSTLSDGFIVVVISSASWNCRTSLRSRRSLRTLRQQHRIGR